MSDDTYAIFSKEAKFRNKYVNTLGNSKLSLNKAKMSDPDHVRNHVGAAECALLRALHIVGRKRPPDKS